MAPLGSFRISDASNQACRESFIGKSKRLIAHAEPFRKHESTMHGWQSMQSASCEIEKLEYITAEHTYTLLSYRSCCTGDECCTPRQKMRISLADAAGFFRMNAATNVRALII
jgi:hypothetical protein